jgi:hypothetical protein
MRQWFLTRFEDPAQNTPYNGAEGGYLYIHGGPCTAEDELYKRFASVIEEPDEYIRRVIDDVESEGLTEWAPIWHEREDEYDDRFALSIHVGSEPLRRLRERLQQAKQVLTLTGDANAMTLAQNLVFASAIRGDRHAHRLGCHVARHLLGHRDGGDQTGAAVLRNSASV